MYHIGMTQWIVGDEPLETSCRRMSECGYDGIEFAAEPYKLDAQECLALMKKYHLDCRSLCGIFGEDRDLTAEKETGENAVRYLKDSVDFAEKVGAKIIIVVPSPVGRTEMPAGKHLEELTENAVRNIRAAADYAQEKGIKFAIEAINRYETWFVNTLEKAVAFVKRIDHPAVGLMADLFHMSIEERSIVDSLYLVRDYLLHVHIADNTREPAGMGHTDFKEVLRALERIGYTGSLTMEFMYRLANPYSAQEMESRTGLMDSYAKQAIDYIRMTERSVADFEEVDK
ncbi:MAG TPA: sugar phosphate isomerase/epimerase [Candidatus Mediterraneibacter merdipullorum]|nr:sugar phosphate isomerase/epimerase [Candidatus Mediterraneibacter merdipullorum]